MAQLAGRVTEGDLGYVAQEGDALMAKAQQVLDRQTRPRDVVDDDP